MFILSVKSQCLNAHYKIKKKTVQEKEDSMKNKSTYPNNDCLFIEKVVNKGKKQQAISITEQEYIHNAGFWPLIQII